MSNSNATTTSSLIQIKNYGNVYGKQIVAGIIGQNDNFKNTTISKITNSGNVYAKSISTGLFYSLGTATDMTVSYLANTGNITNGTNAADFGSGAGLAIYGSGGAGALTIESSYNTGNISGVGYDTNGYAGLVAIANFRGTSPLTFRNVYNTGNIVVTDDGDANSTTLVGGLLGLKYESKIVFENAYNSGNITLNKGAGNTGNLPYIGSIIGYIYNRDANTHATFTNVYASGTLSTLDNTNTRQTYLAGTVYVAGQIPFPYFYNYWNQSGTANSVPQPASTAGLATKTTAELQAPPATLSFPTDKWGQSATINGGLPYLTGFSIPLTITFGALSKIYGDAAYPSLVLDTNYTCSAGCNFAINWNPTSFGQYKAAGTYAYTTSNMFSLGSGADGYEITYATTNSFLINPRPINLTPTAGQTKVYGNDNPASYTYTPESAGSSRGWVNNDTFTGALARAAGETVGNYAINQGSLANSNYSISIVPTNFAISQRPITLTSTPDSKIYGNTDPSLAVTVTGGSLANNSGIGVVDSVADVAGTLTREAGNNVGSYDIALGGGAKASNYAITFATDNNAITIGKRTISLTANKAYDGDNTLTGSQITIGNTGYGETLTYSGGAANSQSVADNATNFISAITLGNGTGNISNYQLPTLDHASAPASITAKTLTLSGTKVYDGSADFASFLTLGGLINTESFAISSASANSSHVAANGSNYISAITLGAGSNGAVASNYVLPAYSYSAGLNAVTVSAKTLTPTLTNVGVTKVYDGDTSSTLTPTYSFSDFVSGDTAATLSYTGRNFNDKDVADATTITVSGLAVASISGSNSSAATDYVLDATSKSASGATITRKDVSVSSLQIADKVYDGTTNASSVQSTVLSGVVLADAANVNTSGTLANFGGKDVGTYSVSVTGLSLTGTEANNYNLTGGTTATDSSVAITKKTVSLSANKIYDGSADLTGFVTLGTGVGSETLTYAGATANNAHVATAGKFINAITLQNATDASGGLASNYQLPTLNTANAPVTITTRPIEITADAKSKTYGNADPALTYTPEAAGTNRGLVIGDTFTGSLTRVAGETVSGGPYAISQGTTLANSDYAITFTGNVLAINQRPITLTATAASKIYGEVDPSLAVSVTGGSLASVTQSDTLANVTGTLSREAGNNVGSYDIALGAGSKASNYAISFATDNNAITINRRPVNVTADAKTKEYGSADPALTFVAETQSSGRGMLGSETLSGALTRVAGETVLGGPYDIEQGGVTNTANGNYAISYTGSNLTIGTKTLTLAGNTGVTKTYDGTTAMPVGNYGYGSLVGIVGSDTVTVSGAPVYDSANANAVRSVLIGNVGIAGSDASNYTMSWTNGSGTINKAQLSVTANADAKFVTQGDVLTTYNGVSYNGFVHGENTGALNITGLSVDRNNPGQNNAGTYSGVLVPSGVTAGNYQISYVNGDYTIVPANQLLVRVQNTSTTYGTGPSYTITDARYMDGSNVIHTLAAPTISGNTVTYSDGVGGGASFTLGPVAAQNSTANQLKAGGYSIGASNVTESSANFSDTLTVTGALTVDRKALSANASNVSKVYDGSTAMNNVVLGYTDLETNDVVTISGNGNFSDKNVGTNKDYTVSSLTLGSTDAANYFLSGGTSLSGSNGEVTKKTVSLAGARTYDGTTTLGSGTVTITTGVGSETLTYSGATAHSKNVGSNYIDAITLQDATDASGGLAGNYQLPGMTANSAQNSVSFVKKALSVVGTTAANKTYDGTTNATLNLGSLLGLVGGEALGLSGIGNFDDPNVGIGKAVAVKLALADGANGLAGNYSITDTSTTANINPVPNVVPPLPPPIPPAPPAPTDVPSMPTPTPVPDPTPGPGTPTGVPGGPGGVPAEPSGPSGDPGQPSGPSGDPGQPSGPSGDPGQPSGQSRPAGDSGNGLGSTGSGSDAKNQPDASSGPGNGVTSIELTLTGAGEVSLTGSSSSASASGDANRSGGFISVRSFGSLDVPSGTLFSFTLPKDTFKHADPKISVTMDARNADGGPLPSWLNFEPGLGRFTGRPPEGLSSFTVQVIARDSSGNEASTMVTLKFSEVKK